MFGNTVLTTVYCESGTPHDSAPVRLAPRPCSPLLSSIKPPARPAATAGFIAVQYSATRHGMATIKPSFLYGVRGGVEGGVHFCADQETLPHPVKINTDFLSNMFLL